MYYIRKCRETKNRQKKQSNTGHILQYCFKRAAHISESIIMVLYKHIVFEKTSVFHILKMSKAHS